MTTDITELAQSLKAAAIDAKELAIIARYSKGRAAAEKFYAMTTPNNVLALVEALERAQRANGHLRDQSAEWERKAISNFEECAKLSQRVEELESRTVTVKLPEPPGPMSVGARTVYFGIVADVVSAFQYGITAAGIKVEVE
ncbi:hypothetical protein M4C49_17500 [Klebsiella pneumoniae]|nr:hypothetical protein [Klebsiella pneumoniae]